MRTLIPALLVGCVTSSPPTGADACRAEQDIVLIIDASTTADAAALTSWVASLIAALVDPDATTQVALITFAGEESTCANASSCAAVHAHLTADEAHLLAAVDSVTPGGKRCTSCGIVLAQEELRASGRASARAAALVIQHGVQNIGGTHLKAIGEAEELANTGVNVSAVGFFEGGANQTDRLLVAQTVEAVGATGMAQA